MAISDCLWELVFQRPFEKNPYREAPSWPELLKNVSERMGVSLDCSAGSSYPEFASKLCLHFQEQGRGSFEDAVHQLKCFISDETALYPPDEVRSEFSSYLKELSPAWIVTTNYDQVLECLLPGVSVSLGPNDSFTSRRGLVPIYHLHGSRSCPEDLIITQEDYVTLFRPNEYRQIRLALAIKESTTCFLGYGLGDVNVLTALDWSRNVFSDHKDSYPHEVIQVLRSESSPKTEPYQLHNKIWVIETTEIADFCKECCEFFKIFHAIRDKEQQTLKNIEQILICASNESVNNFLDDAEYRAGILEALKQFNVDIITPFEGFLHRTFATVRERSRENKAFGEYAKNLDIIIDLLTLFNGREFPPALFAVVARNFEKLAPYIIGGERRELGKSWQAADLFVTRKEEIQTETLNQLRMFADAYRARELKKLLSMG